MKKISVTMIVILLSALFYVLWLSLAGTQGSHQAQIGRDIHFSQTEKTHLSVSLDEKKPLGLYFLASWCHTCHVEYQAFKKIKDKNRQWVAVLYFDDDNSAQLQYPDMDQVFDGYIVDQSGEFSLDWGVKGAPEILIFDHGQLTRRVMRVKDLV
ncbi:hypothetical protein N9C31_03940 [Gammaproteobacteria bacterium]|nr:hypothetical protein [Gammaproteobacteria bacterium]